MKPAIRIGSIVRLKKGARNFLGIVKSFTSFGDETIPSDCVVVLNVFWLLDQGLSLRPLVEEVEVLS
jgi:hypothetical protein